MHQRQHRLRMVLVTAVCLCLCLGFSWSIAANADAKPNPMTEPNVERGMTLYKQNCAGCHGADATGGAGPNLLESSIVREQKYYGNMVTLVIQAGRPERGMPAFPLMSDAQVSDIISFLHARIQVARSEPDASEGGLSLQELLTGNAEAGKRYFDRNCASCHSPTGDLAGVAKKYSPVNLQNSFLYPPGNNLITAAVRSPSSREVQGTLVHFDAFYVAIVNRDGWYCSWPRGQVKVQIHDPLNGHMELLGKYKDKDIHNVFAYLETLR